MEKITSQAALLEAYNKSKGMLALRLTSEHDIRSPKKEILCCGGTGCHASESLSLMQHLREEIRKYGLENDVKVVQTGCFGFCAQGPIVKIMPDNVFYVQVTPGNAREIIEKHIISKELVEDLLFIDPMLKERIQDYEKMSFYAKQKRIALRNCGLLNPEDINEYIAHESYQALAKALFEMTPEQVVQEILNSGLCGRGGAGFPTGLKWKIAAGVKAEEKYIICNADEGDPGAFMDRSILEGDPHSVIEAMAIGAYAIGAKQGYVYIRAEYPLALQRLTSAIEQARSLGLLGKNIMGTDFSFDIDFRLGAGAFVCGEETALIHSIEGLRGEPTTKPPFPANIGGGVWGCSTNVNNVETYASIPMIILKGAPWYRSIGNWKAEFDENGNWVRSISGNSGTKVFALAGQINNVGLVEVPMGTTLREIIYEIGDGISGGREFKAVQTGGPSGGCITSENLDTPIDYANLQRIGSMMGSGGMIVLSDKDCMPSMAKFYLEFTKDESCGKCTPCRIGNRRMLEMLEQICNGNGTMEMLDELEQLARTIADTALCGLGQTAPNPILNTLRYFKDEYIAHVRDKKCPAGNCPNLYTLTVTDDCIGCTKCKRNCPVGAITGEVKQKHFIDPAKCIKCGQCIDNCPKKAIVKG
ncbi:MAG: NADH-quinone oxidoreductase subunit NuoF [Lentisphaerae bacterium]|nr:NADH-quinone oxidoreductase subunit NuoF [Lentisphaerota bacterium]